MWFYEEKNLVKMKCGPTGKQTGLFQTCLVVKKRMETEDEWVVEGGGGGGGVKFAGYGVFIDLFLSFFL